MSLDVMEDYGPELFDATGAVDHRTPVQRMWVSERALPTTARMCGLL